MNPSETRNVEEPSNRPLRGNQVRDSGTVDGVVALPPGVLGSNLANGPQSRPKRFFRRNNEKEGSNAPQRGRKKSLLMKLERSIPDYSVLHDEGN